MARSREVVALRREMEAGAVHPDDPSASASASATGAPRGAGETAAAVAAGSWDTPAARELRGRVKVLEREARKKDATLQARVALVPAGRIGRIREEREGVAAFFVHAVTCLGG